jgi:hypothetical protein
VIILSTGSDQVIILLQHYIPKMTENFSQFLSNIVDMKTKLGIGASGIGLSVAGIAPKVGVDRSIILALNSTLSILSTSPARKFDMVILCRKLNALSRGQYILVTGGKGFGKSCLIETILHRKFGVIYATASSFV